MSNCKTKSIQKDQYYASLQVDKEFDTKVTKIWRPKINKSMFVQKVIHSKEKDFWIIDSGCFRHMIGDRMKFDKLINYKGGNVSFGDDSSRQIKGLGSLMLSDKMSIHDVYYVDGLKYNLLSVSQICDHGYEVVFDDHSCQIKLKSRQLVASGKRSKGNVYNLKDITNTNNHEDICLMG